MLNLVLKKEGYGLGRCELTLKKLRLFPTMLAIPAPDSTRFAGNVSQLSARNRGRHFTALLKVVGEMPQVGQITQRKA